jgi:hypothetical protein
MGKPTLSNYPAAVPIPARDASEADLPGVAGRRQGVQSVTAPTAPVTP